MTRIGALPMPAELGQRLTEAAGAFGVSVAEVVRRAVVSKYIGETEKNLDRIFGAVRAADTIVIFDEADALLGKRGEVKDAHGRHAKSRPGTSRQTSCSGRSTS